jgi:hypothetical protein
MLARAVEEAQGHCGLGAHNPAQLQQEARRWLADADAVASLVARCGLDRALVLRRVRQLLTKHVAARVLPERRLVELCAYLIYISHKHGL